MKTDDAMRARIRQKREAAGMSQAALAAAVGASQQTIDRIERGAVGFSRTVPRVLQVLDIDPPPDVAISTGGLYSHSQDFPDAQPLSPEEAKSFWMFNDLPVYRSYPAEGGFMRGEIVEYVRRPDSLAYVRSGYGVFIIDNVMAPAFRTGEIALVHPHKPPQKGSDVLLYRDAYGTNQHAHLCILRYLSDYDDANWTAVQWLHEDPDEPKRLHETRLSRRDWPTCHVVVAKLAAR